MKYLKKFNDILENVFFSEYASKDLPPDLKENLINLFYGITDYDIKIGISKGTVGGYENNITIDIGNFNVPLGDAIKFNFNEIHIITILEVIDYLKLEGRELEYFWFRNKLNGEAKTIYPKDIEKELRRLPNELYFINLQFR
jgi:hypothetical protein